MSFRERARWRPRQTLLVTAMLATASAAWAAPGTPGVPQPPAEIFKENFESTASPNPATGHPLMLNNYVSAARDANGNPMTYFAAGKSPDDTAAMPPFWVNPQYCNGLVLNSQTTFPAATLDPAIYGTNPRSTPPGQDYRYCESAGSDVPANAWNALQALANVLGQISNPGATVTSPEAVNNHAVAAFTQNNNRQWPDTPLTQLQTSAPIAVPAGGRFITFSVASAATFCANTATGRTPANRWNPQLFFNLISGTPGAPDAVSTPLNTVAIDPCTDPDAKIFRNPGSPGPYLLPKNVNGSPVYASQFVADKPLLITGTAVTMQLINNNATGMGNDAAIDNLLVLDVTPQLDKQFIPAQIANGGVSKLTFTVTNTTDLTGKTGWSFTDTLPAGLQFASPTNLATTCTATPVLNLANKTLTVNNGAIETDAASCTVTVDVTTAPTLSPLTAAGTSAANGPGAVNAPGVVTTQYLNPPASATLTITPAADMQATSTPATQSVVAGFPATVTSQCRNAGPDVAAAATCDVSVPAGVTIVSQSCTPAAPVDLAVNSSIDCTITIVSPTTGDVTVSTKAGTSSTDRAPLNNDAFSVVTFTAPQADMKASAPRTVNGHTGQEITVTTTCTNLGPQVAANATCTIPDAPAGATVSCKPQTPVVSLAKDAAISCDVKFTPTSTAPVTFTTVAHSDTQDPDATNNSAPTQVVTAASADMQASAPSTVTGNVGETISVTSTCTNVGPDAAAAATCEVTGVPADANAKTVCAPESPVASLAKDTAISCTTTFTPTVSGAITLTTKAGSSTFDPTPGNNTAVTALNLPVAADMQASAPTALQGVPGKTVKLTTTCTNAGPDAAVAASCEVTGLPGSANGKTVCTPASPVASLAKGAVISCETTFTPADDSPITLITTASSTTFDPHAANNKASTEVRLSAPTDPAAVPVDARWMLMLLSLALGGFAWRQKQRR